MCLNFEITQSFCNNLLLKDYSVYDLSKGNVDSVKLKVLVPGQTAIKSMNIPFGEEVMLNSYNLGMSNDRFHTQPLAEGYYEFIIVVTQKLGSVLTETSDSFCFFNTCSIDCTIAKKTLEHLQNKCCEDNDCSQKVSKETKEIETLKLYREGLKAAAASCKKELAAELYKCLQYKLSVIDDKCDCK